VKDYEQGFEENDRLRSDFIRDLTLRQLDGAEPKTKQGSRRRRIPRTLVRFWHEPDDVPTDVRACLDSWDVLREEGFALRMYGDKSAGQYIAERYGRRERAAFALCRHPAMRSDYFRMCFVLAEGGLYVDADDVLRGGAWRDVCRGSALQVQPLCYDVPGGGMLPASDISRPDLPTAGRIFYVNNNPLAAPAGHPVLKRALARATSRLLGGGSRPEIQSTTGPGNLSAALAAHAREALMVGVDPNVKLLMGWEEIAEPCWTLDYRRDARNWRNMDGYESRVGPRTDET
jgi:hypothetical protein